MLHCEFMYKNFVYHSFYCTESPSFLVPFLLISTGNIVGMVCKALIISARGPCYHNGIPAKRVRLNNNFERRNTDLSILQTFRSRLVCGVVLSHRHGIRIPYKERN